ncbi:MAG: hypothetical protein ACR2JZ_05190 [Candidatus Limnocylindrales bacterium]
MSEHTTFLQLAASSVDFELDTAAARTLAGHLDTCEVCRRTAAALRSDAAALRALPRRAPPPGIASAIMRAARGEARAVRSPLLLLGLGFLLVAALAGAAVGGALIRDLEVQLDDPSPSTAPSLAPTDAAVVAPPANVTLEPSGPPQSEPPSAEPSASTEPSASLEPRLGVEWQILTAEEDQQAAPQAVTAGGPGFVSVGRACDLDPDNPGELLQCRGAVALSSDGVRWRDAPLQAALDVGNVIASSGPQGGMIGVAAGPSGLVGIGYSADGAGTADEQGGVRAAVWSSADGRTWQRVPDDDVFDGARFKDVAATEEGFVIAGAVYGPSVYGAPALRQQPRGAIWTSNNGRDWERVPDGPIFDVGGYLDTGEEPGSGGPRSIAVNRDGIIAAGVVCGDAGQHCMAAFWSGPDGATWKRAVLGEPNTGLSDVAATSSGLVGIGSVRTNQGCGVGPTCTGAVFTSDDGRTWRQTGINVPAGVDPPSEFSEVFVVGERFLAIVADDSSVTPEPTEGQPWLWRSDDGTTWNPVNDGLLASSGPSSFELSVAVGPGRIVIVGDMHSRLFISPPQ